MFKKKPPTRIDFTLKKIKNGGYILIWTTGVFNAIFGAPNRQAFTTYDEAINAIAIITEPLT